MDKILVSFILVFGLFIGCFGGLSVAIFSSIQNHSDALEKAESQLQSNGFHVAQGETHSPAIIEITDNYDVFVSFAHANKVTKIYRIQSSSGFLILLDESYGLASSGFLILLDESYGLEYRPKYHQVTWWIW